MFQFGGSLIHRFRCAAVMVFALLFVATLSKMSFAQVTKGSISGNVVDPTGALVSDATLKATDTQTGVVFQATSGSSGAFHFNLVPLEVWV
jgi:hypothetical protein